MNIADPGALEKKVDEAKKICREALEKWGREKLALAWTGGKDSTLVLFIMHKVCQELKIEVPRCFCIDEGDMFDEIKQYFKDNEKSYGVKIELVRNDDVIKAAGGVLGASIKVKDLNAQNQKEVERLGYTEESFDFEPESYVGNHLMKTVVLNNFIVNNGVTGLVEGIRRDEHVSRKDEKYFSERPATEFSPAHTRICPILDFTERNVWEAFFHYKIPICPLYRQGYRSLGARVTTVKNSDVPAWEQDLEHTEERGGRRKDKEHLMAKLRKLGYM